MSLFKKVPSLKEASFAFETFSQRQKIVFIILVCLFLLCSIAVIWKTNNHYLVEIPANGGSFSEGIVGSPRFINPLLAISDADRDLVSLIYSGLTRIGADGKIIPDLAKDYTISDDGLIYTFTLRDNLTWQDGEKLTADDIEFTVNRAIDPAVKSLKRATWSGVIVKKIDDKTIQFILKKPYPSFMENTTMGIIPKHIWEKTTVESFSLDDHNLEAIGSGPYKISSVSKDNNDIPKYLSLIPFSNFALGEPKIQNITIRFYNNEEDRNNAFAKNVINSINSLSPSLTENVKEKNIQIIKSPLPRTFAVYFNQNHSPLFADKNIRQALDLATDRNTIINKILNGYGQPLDGVFPPNSVGYRENDNTLSGDIEKAKAILAKNGWVVGSDGVLAKTTKDTKTKKSTSQRLVFSLATSNVTELKAVATMLKQNWSKLGVQVDIQYYEPTDLNQIVIRPRKYDALLFGEIMGRDADPFPFWHSSQRTDPGLNIAMYTNSKVDKLLEEARSTYDSETRVKDYQQFASEIAKDTPAIFLYSPYFIYVLPKEINGVSLPTITNASERFSNVYNWYIKTDHVWSFFAKAMEKFHI